MYNTYMFSLILIFKIILIVVLIVVDIILVRSIVGGAPYAPTKPKTVAAMIERLNIHSGDKAVDIGSGDGRLVIALAKAGAEAHGYETNPLLVWWSRYLIRRAGVQDHAFIHRQSFWDISFNPFSIVTLFGMTHIMERLSEKFRNELPSNAIIAVNTYTLRNWEPDSAADGIYLYKQKIKV